MFHSAAIVRHHRRREMSHLALFEKNREIIVTLLVHEQLVERLAIGVVGGASSRNKMSQGLRPFAGLPRTT